MKPSWMRWFRDYEGHRLEGTPEIGRELVYLAIDSGQNDKLIVFVAGLGFFVDSYILFASNVIQPMLSFVYWHAETEPTHEFCISAATLCGCIFGMVLFGWLGDKFGRRKVYGWELLVLMVGTIGVVMSSTGYVPTNLNQDIPDWGAAGSMDVYSWLLWCRFAQGVGIGGDYPLSSTLVSEFSPTSRRSWMLSLVFSTQAFGYAAASVVAIIVTACVQARHGADLDMQSTIRAVDQIWRWTMGLSLVPGVVAMVMRLNIPESPRYTLDVADNTIKAFDEVNRFGGGGVESNWANALRLEGITIAANPDIENSRSKEGSAIQVVSPDAQPSFMQYFFSGPRKWYQRNWTLLAGTALAWFALDLGFFALALNSPTTVAKIWWPNGNNLIACRDTGIEYSTKATFVWNPDLSLQDPYCHIYTILFHDNWQSLITSSIGAILGSVTISLMLWRSKLNQRLWQLISFGILAVLLIVTGACYYITVGKDSHGVTIVLYILCQFFFYFGPNTLTFIIPAQLFPTQCRATAHGISAAAGKLGSVIIQAFLAYNRFGRGGAYTSGDPNDATQKRLTPWLGFTFMVCAIPMLAGAFITWCWIPDLQKRNGENLTLEELVDVKQIRRHDGSDSEE